MNDLSVLHSPVIINGELKNRDMPKWWERLIAAGTYGVTALSMGSLVEAIIAGESRMSTSLIYSDRDRASFMRLTTTVDGIVEISKHDPKKLFLITSKKTMYISGRGERPKVYRQLIYWFADSMDDILYTISTGRLAGGEDCKSVSQMDVAYPKKGQLGTTATVTFEHTAGADDTYTYSMSYHVNGIAIL